MQDNIPSDWSYEIEFTGIEKNGNGAITGIATKFKDANLQDPDFRYNKNVALFSVLGSVITIGDWESRPIRFKNKQNAVKKILELMELRLQNMIEIVET